MVSAVWDWRTISSHYDYLDRSTRAMRMSYCATRDAPFARAASNVVAHSAGSKGAAYNEAQIAVADCTVAHCEAPTLATAYIEARS